MLLLVLHGGPLDGQVVAFDSYVPHLTGFPVPSDMVDEVGAAGALYRRAGAPEESGGAEFVELFSPPA